MGSRESACVITQVRSTGKARSPFRYPGGKSRMLRTLRPKLDRLVAGKRVFCDVFVGGGSVLLDVAARYPDTKLVANDADYGIACFWRIVASDQYPELCNLLRDAEVNVEAFKRMKVRDLGNLSAVEAAYTRLYLNRTSYNGLGRLPQGGKTQANPKYSILSHWNLDDLITRIENCHRLLAGRLEVTNLHFRDFLRAHRYEPCYLDPPYTVAGLGLYSISMSHQEHEDLANLLLDRADWLLSIDDAPQVRKWYRGAAIRKIPVQYSIVGRKTRCKRTHELLIADRVHGQAKNATIHIPRSRAASQGRARRTPHLHMRPSTQRGPRCASGESLRQLTRRFAPNAGQRGCWAEGQLSIPS